MTLIRRAMGAKLGTYSEVAVLNELAQAAGMDRSLQEQPGDVPQPEEFSDLGEDSDAELSGVDEEMEET